MIIKRINECDQKGCTEQSTHVVTLDNGRHVGQACQRHLPLFKRKAKEIENS